MSIGFALRSQLLWSDAGIYIAAQLLGGLGGVWVAHLMFELPLWQFSIAPCKTIEVCGPYITPPSLVPDCPA